MFACEHYGLEPDLMTMAKSLGGGLPISAVTGRAEIMDSAQVGGLGGTYAGNPVACAAALAAIDFDRDGTACPSAPSAIGTEVERRFRGFVERFPFVGDARGLGAMRALELVKDRGTKEPDKDRTDRVIQKAYETGLLLVGAGTYGNVIRTLMPLVITDAELDGRSGCPRDMRSPMRRPPHRDTSSRSRLEAATPAARRAARHLCVETEPPSSPSGSRSLWSATTERGRT